MKGGRYMTDEDREWLREGVRRAEAGRAIMSGLTWQHIGYYFLVGWLSVETQIPMYHDGGGIF